MNRPSPILLAAALLAGSATLPARATAETIVMVEQPNVTVWRAPPAAVVVESDAYGYAVPPFATLWTYPTQSAIVYNHPPRLAVYAIDPVSARVRVGRRVRKVVRVRHAARKAICCCGKAGARG